MGNIITRSFRGLKPYRSQELTPGYFRELGSVHVHIDGGGDEDLLNAILTRLHAFGNPHKLSLISNAIRGPQRLELPTIYENHSPGTGHDEQFKCFYTIRTRSMGSAVELIDTLLEEYKGSAGLVIELETVVATLDAGKWCVKEPLGSCSCPESRFRSSQTLPFEVHHAFDIHSSDDLGTQLPAVGLELAQRGINAGGWFIFEKDVGWSIRSNAFFSEMPAESDIAKQQSVINGYLRTWDCQYKLWTIVEQIGGIWKTPAQRRTE